VGGGLEAFKNFFGEKFFSRENVKKFSNVQIYLISSTLNIR
jgi:hypothetical protein